MKAVPLAYIARNLWVRRVTTLLTAGGMALVVFVFATVLMMTEGIRATLVATGQPDNVIVLRKGAGAEINSGITRGQAAMVESLPGIATDARAGALVSKEPVVLNNLPKRSNGKPSNVTVRGTSALGLELRPQVRWSRAACSAPAAARSSPGARWPAAFEAWPWAPVLRFAGRDWTVVGLFDAGKSGFDSEIWGDAEQLMQAFRRQVFSTRGLPLADARRFERAWPLIDADPRLTLEAKRETASTPSRARRWPPSSASWALSLAVIFSIGAVVGAMITMFGAVASRVGEIGTLRALGFRRGAVLVAFLGEALLLSLVGGVVGLAAASGMQAVDVSTTNFQTFANWPSSSR
jgi:putative ABC transport system permease protein